MRPVLLFALLAAGAGCGTAQPGGMSGPTMNNRMAPAAEPAPPALQSNDILAREQVSSRTVVKHILIGWRDLTDTYGERMDPRAAARSKREAEDLAGQLAERLRAGEPIEPLMAEYSEDGGSARSGDGYEVVAGNELVFEFRRMGLRLHPNEVGIVLSPFGWHIMQRVE
jgi:hypothetical protein